VADPGLGFPLLELLQLAIGLVLFEDAQRWLYLS
jgi:hypothetical protein